MEAFLNTAKHVKGWANVECKYFKKIKIKIKTKEKRRKMLCGSV